MKGKKTIGMVCVAAASFMHMNVQAASGKEGLDACVSALVQELSAGQGSAVQGLISDDSYVPNHKLSRHTTIHLDARDTRNSEIVAKADCVVDSRAKVKDLTILPADAPEATVRSL
jgi:hypothetical protein